MRSRFFTCNAALLSSSNLRRTCIFSVEIADANPSSFVASPCAAALATLFTCMLLSRNGGSPLPITRDRTQIGLIFVVSATDTLHVAWMRDWNKPENHGTYHAAGVNAAWLNQELCKLAPLRMQDLEFPSIDLNWCYLKVKVILVSNDKAIENHQFLDLLK